MGHGQHFLQNFHFRNGKTKYNNIEYEDDMDICMTMDTNSQRQHAPGDKNRSFFFFSPESDLQWPRVGQPPKITEIGCERSFGPSLKAKLIEGKAEAKAVEVMRASDETEDAEEEEENSEEPEPRLGVGDKLKGKATQLALGDVKGEEEEASEKEEKKKKKKVKRKKRKQDPQAQLLAQAVQA